MILFGYCTKCKNTGKVLVKGDIIPNEELTDRQFAERMVEGGFFYRAVEKKCPDLHKYKHK